MLGLLVSGLLLGLAAGAGPQTVSEPELCKYDRHQLLALDFPAFDQDLKGGWRPLADIEGCEGVAADLIAEYRALHSSNLTPSQVQGLQWHEGQLRAARGEYALAADLMTSARAGSPYKDDQLYALATIAFLRRDRQALEAARQQLASLPEPDWFREAAAKHKAKYGRELAWPPNLEVVNGLAACFDRPYREAYSLDCRRRARD